MSINLATKASDKVVEKFHKDSCTEGLFNERYNWTGVKTLQIYTVQSPDLNNYNASAAAGVNRFGPMTELGDTMQEMSVADDKAFNATIDKGNNTSQMMIKSASAILKQTTEEKIIPYVDKYRLAKLAAGAGGKKYSVTITDANIVSEIFAAGVAMSNAGVPKSGRVLFIGETNAMKLKLAGVLYNSDSAAHEAIVNGAVGVIDGTQLRVVPDDYLPAGVNFMIVRKGCAVAPVKVETYRVIEDDATVDGSIVQGRILHDCFVIDALKNGIYAVYSTAQPSGND
ncbi:MAG: hypothetical protein II881_00920 [Oscillospiraceae bacterium]|nr:hypothetical protein [Oscillospiraceae bacterium]